MRRLEPKEKDRRKVAIPRELRDALREVFETIKEARHDSDIDLDHGDAIQSESICGGKIGDKRRPYVLTFFPDGDADRGRWFLNLHHTDIEDLADGRMSDILMYCCKSPDCRFKFREASDHCFYCDYVDD